MTTVTDFKMTDEIIDAQRKLEEMAIGLGVERFKENLKRNAERGEEDMNKGSRVLTSTAVPAVSQAIEEFVEKVFSGKSGRRALAAVKLKDMDYDTVAFLALKGVFAEISQDQTLQVVAFRIAQLIEDEQRFKAIESQDPKLWRRVHERLKERGANYEMGRGMIHTAAERAEELDLPEPWESNEKLNVGLKLIEIVEQYTGLIEREKKQVSKTKSKWLVVPTEKAMKKMKGIHDRAALNSPMRLPCVVPPAEWTTPFNGGYHFALAGKLTLVKTRAKAYLEELESVDLSRVYKSINALQNTAWQVNSPVLRVAKECRDRGIDVPGLTLVDNIKVPKRPEGVSKESEEYKAWRYNARQQWEARAKARPKARAMARVIWLAETMEEYDQFFYPYTMDFRGRVYPVVSGLQPQGEKLAKGLLRFAHGEKLGEEGAYWLAVHIANVYGEDKLTLDERVRWTQEHTDEICAVAMDPMDHLGFWAAADKPWEFLAGCFEWLGWSLMGDEYVSHLPIAFDGSCNGLQHYSAMLRDHNGGRATNLISNDQPADIYMDVLKLAIDKLTNDAADPECEKQESAIKWLQSGELDRKMAKRPVMTTPYGSKAYGIAGQIDKELRERMLKYYGEGKREHAEELKYLDRFYLSSVFSKCIAEVVVSAAKGMEYLQTVARVCVKDGLPVHWTTPAGLPILQDYKSIKLRQVKTQYAGGILKLKLAEDTDETDAHKQANAIGPNFIHSLDAAAMMLTVIACVDEGVHSFAMIHDSYATTAARSGDLFRILREQFIEMYSGDVLAQWSEEIYEQLSDEAQAQMPQLPEYGELELDGIMESDFFFS